MSSSGVLDGILDQESEDGFLPGVWLDVALNYLCGPATTQTVGESGVSVIFTHNYINIYPNKLETTHPYYSPRQQNPSQNLCYQLS